MKNIDSGNHTTGKSLYLDDIPLVAGTLFGAAFISPVAHGHIERLDLAEAAQHPGVVRIFTHRDITGENQIGGIIPDEPLLAEYEVDFCGMPIAFVVAETDEAARAAVRKITVDITPLPIITDPRVAQAQGELIVPPRTFQLGDPERAWDQCAYVVEGSADTNGQEHLYIETQCAYAIPEENEGLKIYSSTQSPTASQRAAARVLGVPMHQLEVDVIRLGGGFGGKEDQANAWVALCALAAHHLRKPVKYVLHRLEDMQMTGKRHPYSSDFKLGLGKDLNIIAYESTYYQNAGAAADLSPAIMERTLFHATGTYFIPNVKATAFSCRTHLPPNTAFRGFGGPQAKFVMEAAIAKAAEQLGIDACVIQKQNLNKTGDEFPYGQKAVSEAHACWHKAETLYDVEALRQQVQDFNATNTVRKKGLAFMPICFGISFTNTSMNQARALVHVYYDGSVKVSTGAVEMGQGVNTKLLQVAAQTFSINPSRVRLQTTSTNRIANTSPSAASATADLNGKAVQLACQAIVQRLKEVAAQELQVPEAGVELHDEKVLAHGEESALDWKKLVTAAFLKRVSLSEHAHYATPEVHFNKATEKGHPFAYHVYGTAITIATIDCIRGTYTVDAVKVVHDFGRSMNPNIDRGQIEGGIVQGIGWMTMEELLYDQTGRLRSNTLSTYKVPDIYSVPKEIAIEALQTDNDNLAIFRSKAVGEPPFMYGIGTYFALRNAIKAFNPDSPIGFNAPMTPEKVLLALYPQPATGVKVTHAQSVSHVAVS
ncbi:xanthine dehydrogenase molybdopterin binding subunit [Hymenobacter sp. BT491]|uniref:xanthine dehydrogenase molybdopterin binding subunit n=1 Tax=Hymenobacter sp. BT491 TaxID=2766779 RepID=UPI001653B7E9|nr:molybdopterin cofactor-binding domain-containing protein [Hymenobacter sp. BT491]MBC6991133.1 molybdopterin-dependent oxidoreductase [Hymenobacter sp. BT491]